MTLLDGSILSKQRRRVPNRLPNSRAAAQGHKCQGPKTAAAGHRPILPNLLVLSNDEWFDAAFAASDAGPTTLLRIRVVVNSTLIPTRPPPPCATAPPCAIAWSWPGLGGAVWPA